MTNIAQDIFRSIHEGKWLYIDYESSDSQRKKYWISIHDINLERKSLVVTGLHIGEFTTKELTIYVEKILSSQIMEGTYYQINTELLNNIEAFPQKYSPLFSNIANLGREEPVLAIELDGPEHHNNQKVIARDMQKKQICKNHGFDLIHVDNSYARRYNFIKDILEEFFKGEKK